MLKDGGTTLTNKAFSVIQLFRWMLVIFMLVVLIARGVSSQTLPSFSVKTEDKTVTISVEYEGNYSLDVFFKTYDGKDILKKSLENVNFLQEIVVENLSPGLYIVEVHLHSGSRLWEFKKIVHIIPSSRDMALLLAKISKILAYIEQAPHLYDDLGELIDDLKEYYQSSLQAFVRGDLNESAYYYMKTERLADDLYEIIVSRSGAKDIYSSFAHLEDYLSFNTGLVLDFWLKIFASTIILPLFVIIFAPLYISSTEDWIKAVIETIDTKNEALYTAVEETRKRALELLQGSVRLVSISIKTYLMTTISALIAAIGLIINNTVVIIASMLIAPFMSVVLGAAIGLAMPHREVTVNNETKRGEEIFSQGLRNIFSLSITSLIVVVIAVWATSLFLPIIPGKEIMVRSRPNFSDLAIAIGAGLAGAVSYIGILEFSGLIGAAIAIALIPPLATIGVGVAIGRLDIALGAFSLLYINIISIILSVILVIKFYIIIPILKYFFINLLRTAENEIEIIAETIQLWFNATFGFKEGWDRRTIIYNLTRLLKISFKYILFPIFVVAFYAMIVSSDIPNLLASMTSLVLSPLYEIFSKLQLNIEYFLFLVTLALMLHYTRVFLRKRDTSIKLKFVVSVMLLWVSFVIVSRIDLFPRVHMIFLTLLTIYTLVVVYWERVRKRWSHYVVLGFTVLTILIISIQSIEIYQSTLISQKLGTESDFALRSVAVFFGVSEKDVKSEILRDKNPRLVIYVYVKMEDFDRFRELAYNIEILEKTLAIYGLDTENLDIYIILKP